MTMPDSLPEPASFQENDWFWTASGKAVGYRENDALFSCRGEQIGEFQGDEVYGTLGLYLGEISSGGRLVTKLQKLNWRRTGFVPSNGAPLNPPHDLASQHLTTGYRNFKAPNHKP